MKKKPTQVKKNQLDGKILVSLNKENWKRYRRAKSQKSGFRLIADDMMITGSGFGNILSGLKSAGKQLASVAVPYVKNKLKTLIPGVRSDIDAGINTGVNFVANKLKTGLSPFLGDQVTNELIDKGTASVKGFAKDKLDGVQQTLQGMGMKRGTHYKMYGGKLNIDLAKFGNVLKNVGKIAIPAMVSTINPAAGVVAGVAADALLGSGIQAPLLIGSPASASQDGKGVVLLAPKVIPMPKKAARGRKKKINLTGSALMPMGKGRGGGLLPMGST